MYDVGVTPGHASVMLVPARAVTCGREDEGDGSDGIETAFEPELSAVRSARSEA
jgi:hypothetical protein